MIGQLVLNGVVSGLLLALPAMAVSLTFGVLRFPNFAVGSAITFGAYAAWLANVRLGLPLATAAVVAALVTGAASILCDLIVFGRMRDRHPVTLMVASLGVGLVLENACRFFFGNAPRSLDIDVARPLRWAGLRIAHEQILTGVVVLSSLAVVYLILNRSRLGRAMRAVADNAALASARGIERETIIRVAWGLIGALTGLSGVLAALDRAVDPLVGASYEISVFAAAILGGLGSPVGAVVGALAIGVTEELATLAVPTTYRQAVSFGVILVLLLVRSQGLFSARAVRR